MDIEEIRKFLHDWRHRKRRWYESTDPYEGRLISMIEFLLAKLDDNYPKG